MHSGPFEINLHALDVLKKLINDVINDATGPKTHANGTIGCICWYFKHNVTNNVDVNKHTDLDNSVNT